MAIVAITIRLRWWVRLYLAGVVMVVRATGLKPDQAKVNRVLERGVVVTCRPWRGLEA